ADPQPAEQTRELVPQRWRYRFFRCRCILTEEAVWHPSSIQQAAVADPDNEVSRNRVESCHHPHGAAVWPALAGVHHQGDGVSVVHGQGDPGGPHLTRKDRDEIFIEFTRSICPVCKIVIDGEINIRAGKVYLRKRCPEHGGFEALCYGD